MESQGNVNPHYLEHVMTTSRKREIEASEDILAGNGMKLLAKGARIDDSVKERLLQHKLRKPLEDCMKVVGGVNGLDLISTAEALLDEQPMLRELYRKRGRATPLGGLRGGMVSPQMESMLTVYAEHGEHKLAHAVGASLLCMGLTDKLGMSDTAQVRIAMLSGLCHDIGELYINPDYLRKGVRLEPAQWKHIAAHPIIAQRVLKDMAHVGEKVGLAVLGHHERLDGFGYPFGLLGDKVPISCQVLGVSELLIGLLESRRTPLRAAEVALKLIPGEFGRPLIDVVSTLCRACTNDEDATAQLPAIDEIVERASKVAAAGHRIDEMRSRVDEESIGASAAFRDLLVHAANRYERIRRAFSSTGLDAENFEDVLHHLNVGGDTALLLEMTLVMREVNWRYRELEREVRARVARSMPQEVERIGRVLALIKQDTALEDTAAA